MRLVFVGFFANMFIVVFAWLGCMAEARERHLIAAVCLIVSLLFLFSAIYVKACRSYYADGNRG